MSAEMDVIRRVYEEGGNGAHIEVGPDGDGLGIIEMKTVGKVSTDWFGAVRLGMRPDTARLIAKALIAAADEADGN